MDDDDDLAYQEALQENFYLFSRYLVPEDFLEKLISEKVLSIDDKELITNHTVNQNRRQRANKFLEILMTKGRHGYDRFLEVLEYNCPHVFKDVTKKEPRDPPDGFERNRNSDRLRIVHDLPNLLEQIKDKYLENTELDAQLSALHGIVEISKEENLALEKEVQNLKNTRLENEQLNLAMQTLKLKMQESEDTVKKWMEKAFDHMEKEGQLKDRNQDLQVKYDELYKQLNERKVPADRKSEPVNNKPAVPAKPTLKPKPTGMAPGTHRERHVIAEKDILREELDDYRTQCEEITSRLQKSDELVARLESQLETREQQHKQTVKEMKVLSRQLKDAEMKSEQYYKTIQDKGREILQLENDKIQEQSHVRELKGEKNIWFDEKHSLENELRNVKTELDLLRCRIRDSGSSFSHGSSGSDDEVAREDFDNIVQNSTLLRDFDGIDFRRQCKSVYERRNCGPKKHSLETRKSRTLLPQEHVDLDDMDDNFKANTLPTKANESPETLFQREIAHFRYTKRKLEASSSLAVQLSHSMKSPRAHSPEDDPARVWALNAEHFQNTQRGESAPVIPDNVSDNASSMLIPRTTDPQVKSPLPRPNPHREFSVKENHFGNRAAQDPVPIPFSQSQHGYKKDSIESGPYTVGEVPVSEGSGESELVTDFSCHEVFTQLLPRDCMVVTKKGILDKHMSRFLHLKVPVLGEKLDIVGGNHTGIYISKVHFNTPDFAVGDQIKSITYRPVDHAEEVVADLKGCCLQGVYKLLSGDYVRKKKEGEVRLEVRRCQEEYESARKWMEANNNHGDFYFIRCNETFSKDAVHMKCGDIFLVRNSHYEEKWWQGYFVDVVTGSYGPDLSVIPSKYRANVLRVSSTSRSNSEADPGDDSRTRQRVGGIKLKGQAYDFVLPMKASVKLPVYIIGPDGGLLSVLLNVISRQLPTKFVVDKGAGSDSGYGGATSAQSELYRQDKHLVRECCLEKLKSEKSIQRIILFVNVTTTATSITNRKQYGQEFDVDFTSEMLSKCLAIKQKLVESGQYFEELTLPAIQSSEDLVNKFKARVKSAQERIRWLSRSEVDKQVAESYSRYLGYPLNDIHFKLQISMSYDQSFETTSP